MPDLLMIMFLLPLIGCLFAMLAPKNTGNAFNVAIFTMSAELLMILLLFSKIGDDETATRHIMQTYDWINVLNLKISFGINSFSLIILLGVYLALIIGLAGLAEQMRKNKSLMLVMLYFVWTMTGFFIADDIVSFYIFYAAMLLPMFMLSGLFGYDRNTLPVSRFFMYNFCGVFCLLAAMAFLYRFYHGNILLENIAFIDMNKRIGIAVWLMSCFAFISRIPVWPFHYWFSSVNYGVKNPLVYIVGNMLPLTGLYAMIRFWPLCVPESVELLVPFIEILSILTMIFIALIGFANKEFLYKLFSYNTVYYMLFLLAVILPTDTLKMNIAYSLFIFMIVGASLVVLDIKMEEKNVGNNGNYHGMLAYMPKFAKVLSFFVLIAIGLPISSFFWSNFVLISALFAQNVVIGTFVVLAICLVATSLIKELYDMHIQSSSVNQYSGVTDLSNTEVMFWMSVISLLLLSFFDPMWFVF